VTKLLDYVNNNSYFEGFVVQKYIEQPFTILNKKFDIRQFVLVTSLDPLTVFLFEDCYLRFCTEDYSTEGNLEDLYVHLTNHQVQKSSAKFHDSPIKESQWSLETFKRYLRDDLKQPDVWSTRIQPQIEQIAITTMKSWPKRRSQEL